MNSQTERIVDWLSQLVQIPSVNPVQGGPRAGVAGEKAIADFLAGRFREFWWRGGD